MYVLKLLFFRGKLFIRQLAFFFLGINLFLSFVLKANVPASSADDKDSTLEHESQNAEQTLIITADRALLNSNEVLSSSGIVDNETIEKVSAEHINQVLKSVPGVWISRGNGQEHLTAIRSPVLTGAGACGAFLMAEDGISLRSAGFCNANQLFDVNGEQAQVIEVIRGPGSTLFGSNAQHGVINVLSPDLFTSPVNYVSLETGSLDHNRIKFANTFTSDSNNESSSHAFYGNYADAEGYQAESGYQQYKFNWISQFKSDGFTNKTMIAIADLDQETAGFIQGFESYKDQLLKKSNPNPEAYRKSRSIRAYSKFNWSLDDSRQLTLTPYLRSTDMNFLQHYLPWKAQEQNAQESLGMKSVLASDEDTYQWYLGFDWELTQGELQEFQEDPFAATIPQGMHYEYQVDATSYAPYFDIKWELEDLVLNFGIRYDVMEYDYQNNLSDGSACDPAVVNCRFYRPASQKRDFSNWSPKLAMNYQFSDNLSYYFEAAKGFRAPQATELFRLQGGQTISDVKNEVVDSIQMGVRGNHASLNYQLAVYSMDKDNYIFQDSNRFVVNNGQTCHKGVELSLGYQINDDWSVLTNNTYARHLYENDILISNNSIKGNLIDTAPKHIANARLDWRYLDSTNWQLEYDYLGNYFLNPDNSASYEGHQLWHLRGVINFDKTQISLRITNLTDEDYAERADFGFGQHRYFIGLPRSISVGIKYLMD